MTPDLLDQLLTALRKNGVVSAEVPLQHGALRVVFAPEVGAALPPGDPITPGGWKSPERLDDPAQFDVPLSEAP